jgi:hypothetical protein
MTGKRDPLSELFSNVELTGLSNTRRSSSTETPLQLDIPETSEPVETSATKRRKPMRPPRLDPNDTLESDIEIEEMSSEEEEDGAKDDVAESSPVVSDSSTDSDSSEVSESSASSSEPEIDPQEKIRMVLARQARQRNKMAILEQQKQKAAGVGTATSSTPTQSKPTSSTPSQGERLARMDAAKTETPSAMELFMAAVEESKQKKEQRKTNPQPTSITPSAPVVSASSGSGASSGTDSAISPETAGQPLMGNRLILTVEGMIQSHLPGLKQFHVASALDSFDRRLLKAIWTRYRMKFLISGQLEYAVASLSVVDALETVEDGQLVAAYVETTASDYLIWVDLTHGRLVAAFADAGRYFAN